MRRFLLSSVLALTLSGGADAHPHIFVETALHLQADANGTLIGIEVTWSYDALYTLLILEDRGLDPDYDGVLTQTELADLKGFDLNWSDDFAGDLYVRSNGVPVPLGRPEAVGTHIKGGKLTTVHRRPVDFDVVGRLVIKAYDPTFYTAYDLGGGVRAGGPCKVDVIAADLDAAYARTGALLADLPADQAEGSYPNVGEAFADEVGLTCAP